GDGAARVDHYGARRGLAHDDDGGGVDVGVGVGVVGDQGDGRGAAFGDGGGVVHGDRGSVYCRDRDGHGGGVAGRATRVLDGVGE
ncbi:hypothetical protein C6A85_23350, partial [Mycobacterium sp. ITM-2017-0098]